MKTDSNLDPIFEKLWQKHYENYVQDFETAKKRARNLNAYIDHCEAQIRVDFPGANYVNHYIKDVIYYFYQLYYIGKTISEIIDKILELRKEHLSKISEHPMNYERSSDGFNLDIENQTYIMNFIANHYAKNQFLKFLEGQKNKEMDASITGIAPEHEIELEESSISKKQKPTNAQKLLTLHYLQKVNLFPVTPDILPLSEFITFLTGQNQKNTYDQLREIDDYKKTKKNLLVVRKQFERLGLDEVIKLIDDDLKNCWK